MQEMCCLTKLRHLGIETRLPSKELQRRASKTLPLGALPHPLPPLGLPAIPSAISRLSQVQGILTQRVLCSVVASGCSTV